MSWFVDEYEKITHTKAPGVFTGKPLTSGGSEGRTEATGFGGSYVLLEHLSKIGTDPKALTIALQGIGNVGTYFAYAAEEAGMRIVALADAKGAAYNEDGFTNIKQIIEVKETRGNLYSALDSLGLTYEKMSSPQMLELPVSVIVPAALENAITEENAPRIQAPLILELANGPTTREADAILSKKGTVVIPDILANAGGVATSYFEWVQNMQSEQWAKEKVLHDLEHLMRIAYRDVAATAQELSIPLREAAFVVALMRIQDAHTT
jgi:glutamate dehydrogenase/leucine dehydrogenase